jgi:uncharacterized OsmC-like protein
MFRRAFTAIVVDQNEELGKRKSIGRTPAFPSHGKSAILGRTAATAGRRTAMDANALRRLQEPLKAEYRERPDAARLTLRAEGELDDARIVCKVDTGRALVEAGLHEKSGGNGVDACSGDMLLEALVACAGVTLKAVATALGIAIRSGRVRAEGDLDFRGTLGVDKQAPVGFAAIRLRFEVDSDASPDQLAKLLSLTERYCVVYQSLRTPPAFAVEIAGTPQP